MAANQYIRIISEGSCDSEGWSNDAENSALSSIQVYLYSAFYDTNRCKAALQEIKFLQYIYIL